MITLRICGYFPKGGTTMCDKIDDEYIDFLENYLSDVLTGQMYADVDTVSISNGNERFNNWEETIVSG